jgi:small subunit ribosomal protein S18
MANTRKKPVRVRVKDKVCAFCKDKTVPAWQDYEKLGEFLSPRGRILPRGLSGVCVKHQRRLAEAIKQARHLALMPFVTQD